MSYVDRCPQRKIVEIYHTIATWLPVKLECGHIDRLNWTPIVGQKTGCTDCQSALDDHTNV